MNVFTRIGRMSRSLLTLNRDREYQTLKRMLELRSSDHAKQTACIMERYEDCVLSKRPSYGSRIW